MSLLQLAVDRGQLCGCWDPAVGGVPRAGELPGPHVPPGPPHPFRAPLRRPTSADHVVCLALRFWSRSAMGGADQRAPL